MICILDYTKCNNSYYALHVLLTYQMMSPPLRPCQPSGTIWRHTYSAAVTTLSDTARTYSDCCGPRGGVAA